MTVVGFLIGVGTYGPIAMFGVMAMESAPDKIAGTAHAISSMFSNCKFFLAVQFNCTHLLLGWFFFFQNLAHYQIKWPSIEF